MPYLRYLAIITLLALICACKPPRPLTFEEQQVYMAKQQCSQEATNMNPEWPSSSNPYWDSYFTMCMNSMGISDATLEHMWY